MKAEIIAVGTELLMGQIDNTNASYISKRLPECGVFVLYHSVVGDNKTRLSECIKIALKRTDVIILTGGLGPTQDDLTKETVSDVLGLELIFQEELMNNIQLYFSKLKYDKKRVVMTSNNEKQAFYPKDSKILPNRNGTAAGCIISKVVDDVEKTIVLLPGPPWEMQPMFDEYVMSYFLSKNNEGLKSVFLRLFGIGESAMESLISDVVTNQTNPTIAPYAKKGEVMLRVTAKYDKKKNNAHAILKPVIDKLNERLSQYIYAYEDLELKDVTSKLLLEKNITVSFAESCTGGMLSEMITDISGISKVYNGSVVAYSNEIKSSILAVKKSTLDKYGAVSSQTAIEMAKGVRQIFNSEVGVSITGIAGPSGGTDKKPVGRVYIGLSTNDKDEFHEYTFSGNREKIRYYSCIHAMNILRKYALLKG